MSIARCGERIRGELLKLGIEIGLTSVAKYMRGGGASLAGMEDVPSPPCGWHCRNGPPTPRALRQPIIVSLSNSENDQKRNEFGTVPLPDYSACDHTSLSVEFVASCAAAML